MSDLKTATAFTVALVLFDADDGFGVTLDVGVVLNPVGGGAQRLLRLALTTWQGLRDDWRPGSTIWVTPSLLEAFAEMGESDAAVR